MLVLARFHYIYEEICLNILYLCVLLLQVAYYRLYGRLADGSNVKVRLSDKAYPGLGTEVYPHDIIMMSHLLIVVL